MHKHVPHLRRALRGLVAGLGLAALGAAPAAAMPGTYALVSGQDTNGYPFLSDTHAAGPSQASMNDINGGSSGIAADAMVDFGTMQVRAEGLLFQVGFPMFTAFASTYFQDDLTITGGSGTAMAGITLKLDGVFTDLHSDASASSQDAGYLHPKVEIDPAPSGPAAQTPIDMIVHNLGSGPVLVGGSDLYDGNFTFTYGQPFTLKVAVGVAAITDLNTDVAHAIADFTTAKLAFLTLPAGAIVSTASGTSYPQLVVGATTTTSVPGTTTTTTTTPGSAGCGLAQGFALARCQIDALLAAPLCAGESVPSALDRMTRKGLGRVRGLLDVAEPGPAKKRLRALSTSRRLLRGLSRKVQKAFHHKSIGDSCRSQLVGAIGTLENTIDGL